MVLHKGLHDSTFKNTVPTELVTTIALVLGDITAELVFKLVVCTSMETGTADSQVSRLLIETI